MPTPVEPTPRASRAGATVASPTRTVTAGTTALPRALVALSVAAALLTPLLGASPAWADGAGEVDRRRGRPVTHEDVWTQPNPGLRYLRRTTSRPAVIHALVVDLRVPGVRVEATPHADRWSTVSEFADTGPGYAAAINGGFWSSFADPYGLQVGGGEAWPSLEDDGETTLFAVRADGRARITHRTGRTPTNNHYRAAVSGIPTLVRAGQVADSEIDRIGAAYGRHPRTAVGVSRDGHTVFLVVVDGRRGGSRGLNLYELADFMHDIGAHDAMNLDGGGSSAMFLRRAGGVINAPSGGRWEARLGFGSDEEARTTEEGERRVYVRGVEREVMNHLGVVAPAPEPVAAATSSVLDAPVSTPSRTVVLPPRVSRFRFGRLRESLPVTLPLGLATLGALAWLMRRRRRSRARARSPNANESAREEAGAEGALRLTR
ncbi:MAG: phosphodiester glycosidase family protein [Polyangiales bacterium]|nr:phosphodiester glycosidase family protein [Myxococcales bacterium]MCB9656924.1 phosphodiester glycosidase family protein [Sandaracinaceae bacterium]